MNLTIVPPYGGADFGSYGEKRSLTCNKTHFR